MTVERQKKWFKPKTYGYGAAPANAMGWVAILVYVVADLAVSFVFIVWPVLASGAPSVTQIVIWAVLMVVITVAFVRICVAKTDGRWHWRWGENDSGGTGR